ncbi:adenosylcobinamide-GDP ribazoletransferase [Aureimonas sp. AU12]|uniref:adenosylcobinamide-GDP ribazoletransferase n=1 Tax=Aureimonas sp. AU12 TaxID=1638161 RepID=UPI0007809DBD|nr:adenosylcobinamide-GDP ribazoletransferase [Aureimonas sp. AU12]
MTATLFAFLRACAFLTRLPPVSRAFASGPHPLGRDAAVFPLVGLAAAAGPAALLAILPMLGLGVLPAAAIAVLALVALTGALHEDGLGDAADGLFGHRDAPSALAIMKDSRIGTYGALALTGSVLLRTAFLADLGAGSPHAAALALLAAAALSRGAMAWLWSALPTADRGGLADRVGRPAAATGLKAAGGGAFLSIALGLVAGGASLSGFAAALLPLAFAAGSLAWLRAVLKRRLGGQTGDTLGAAQQITEIAALLGFALAL